MSPRKKSFADSILLGGGIVYDSVEFDEWEETINKLGANMQCITTAEELYYQQQQQQSRSS